jgi:hypothetical protein
VCWSREDPPDGEGLTDPLVAFCGYVCPSQRATTITSLDLDANDLTDAGAVAIAEALCASVRGWRILAPYGIIVMCRSLNARMLPSLLCGPFFLLISRV